MRTLAITLISLLLTASLALADYKPEGDITLSLTLAPKLVKPSGWTGTTSFALQEGLHQFITEGTGQSVDHFYVWIYVNGEPVLALDPAWMGP